MLASLWPVADNSTQELMVEFYRLYDARSGKISKAEAMQQAQKEMIAGKLKAPSTQGVCRSEIVGNANSKKFNCDINAPYSHPYFWSPFVLIGNWR